MRTTIDISEKLLHQARELSPIKTKTGIVNLSLEEFIRRRRVAGIKSWFGSKAIRMTFRDIHRLREHGRRR